MTTSTLSPDTAAMLCHFLEPGMVDYAKNVEYITSCMTAVYVWGTAHVYVQKPDALTSNVTCMHHLPAAALHYLNLQ